MSKTRFLKVGSRGRTGLPGSRPRALVFLCNPQSRRAFKTDMSIHVVIKENTAAPTAPISDL